MGYAGPRGPKVSRSVRVHNDSWERAKRKAAEDGTTINGAIEELMEGYGKGLLNLPKIVKTWPTPQATPPADTNPEQ